MSLKKATHSGEIYADFTMSRISQPIRESFTTEQYAAIREALVASDSSSRHTIDVRGTIPLFFARYYFVILAGRDKRRRTRMLEMQRSHLGNFHTGALLSFVALTLAGALVWVAIFIALYMLKTELGIDIFPNTHLYDFLK